MLNKAFERLVSGERNIRTLVEAAPNGIVVPIRTVNKSAVALLGYDCSEMVGQSVETGAKKQASLARRLVIGRASPLACHGDSG